MIYKAKTPFKERHEKMKLYKKGDVYSYDDNDRIAFLVDQGYLEEVTEEEVEGDLNHVGGGYYELPNGEKVKGKDEALKALAELGD
ncbi:hypothetical protein H9649_07470 [Sporosarcina sp. Sa2YVA2]|uniref:Phage protein n=1 Tax=Sporosarcina quadrami TaxID=2762234 RepID=A0ABR8U8Q6_9BACL|nr:hypothetical protein [Sporosarcina quadrami]MBD7984413.1 hypothetical protein [Sporosarcina quadrami]